MMIKLLKHNGKNVYVSSKHIVRVAEFSAQDQITYMAGCMIRTSESEEDLRVKNSAEWVVRQMEKFGHEIVEN